jgi:serine protease
MVLHRVHYMRVVDACHKDCGVSGGNLSYHGGTNGVGVETAPDKVYLVFWGSQWNNNDPSGEAAIETSFFSGLGGSSWNATVTQYCEGVQVGTTTCTSGTPAANPTGVYAGAWYDNASAAPSRPTDAQLSAEAVNAATHFGNTTAASNTTVQYVINTATDNNAKGFDIHQYCAYHSSVSAFGGNVAFTNMPYNTDSPYCGANFNGLGPNAGITIAVGHEFSETETDIYPAGGWLDSSGAEIGDKCAFIPTGQQGAVADITLSTGTFPVQSLWSNAFNTGAGGCVLLYP